MSPIPEVTYGDPDDDIVDELRRRGFGIVCRPQMNLRTNQRTNLVVAIKIKRF